jgi:SAM-dependent methyltransferase
MARLNGKTSRELGLELASICGKHFLKLEHLHYGYWTADLEVDIANLHKSQENYTNFLVSHIPDGVKMILDVGCGAGQTTKKLIDMGYQVDCVSPSPFLSQQVRLLLGNTSRVFECPYEQMETEKRYDMALFSESFQYIAMDKALEKTVRLLSNGGYLFICDVFKVEVNGNGVIGGGHKMRKFYEHIAHYPFKSVKDLDITEQTAPNLDLLGEAMKGVIAPAIDSSLAFLGTRYPLTVKFLKWRYRKKIDKIYGKYFNGEINSANFKKFKTYRLLIYKKQTASEHGDLITDIPD